MKSDRFFCKVKTDVWVTHLQRQALLSLILAGSYLMDEVACIDYIVFC